MEPVLNVDRGFFPLDEELDLGTSDLTPHAQEGLARLATWLSYGVAAQILQALLGVQVSKASARRVSMQTGEAALQEWEKQAETITHALAEAAQGGGKHVMSADGAMVPLVGGIWGEVKTLAMGELHESAGGEPQVENLSYCSRLTDVPGFEKATLVEVQRRGLEHAEAVAAVMDGAGWLQGVIDYHRADAVRILDFAHAAEYVSAIGEGVLQAGYHLPKNWLQGVLHRLKHQGPQRVLVHLCHLVQRCRDPEVGKKLQYLVQRGSQMQYPAYQAAGWPIGSGMVESANKLVVEARMKGAGMHWKRENVNPMLILRNAVCNDRWAETWQIRMQHLQHTRKQQREEQAQARLEHAMARFLLLFQRSRPPRLRPLEKAISASPNQPPPPSATAGPRRPAANHPWRRAGATRPHKMASAKL